MQLNQDQEKAIQDIENFLLDPLSKEFLLSGSAGTGKTFVMRYLLDNVLNKPENKYNVVFTATTNKAAEVLSSVLNQNVLTIHSFLGLVVKTCYKTGVTSLQPTSKYLPLPDDTLLIIDESSMINYELYEYIVQALKGYSKVIYLGDANQLLAVKSKDCPPFQKAIPRANLNILMRSKGNEKLSELCKTLKENVTKNIIIPKAELQQYVRTITYQKMEYTASMYFKNNAHNNVYLAYTNQSVVSFNEFIRTDIRGLPKEFTTGERLIINNNVEFGDKTYSPDTEVIVKYVDYTPVEEYGVKGYIVSLSVPSNHDINNAFIPYNFDDLQRQMKFFASIKDWHSYFYLKNNVIDLRMLDGKTVHKSQGSTYDDVYLDYNDLIKCRQHDVLSRLLYVACSRAKNNVYMLTDLYGNNE